MINKKDMGNIKYMPFSNKNNTCAISFSSEVCKANRPLRICVDVDDVLAACTVYAVELEKMAGHTININKITGWGPSGTDSDVIFKYFGDGDFYRTQPLYEGAQAFIKALTARGHEVLILTSVGPEFATIRANFIKENFPEIDSRNIIIGARKDLVSCDVLIDDAAHNITGSPARYPVCVDRPWNQNLTGIIRVFSYREILSFIDRIADIETTPDSKPKIYCLVGPSGSGKTAIAGLLAETGVYAIPKSTTTRKRRSGESENAYNFISEDEFQVYYENGRFLETTTYAGSKYGTFRDEFDKVLDKGLNAVFPIDMTGANALKMAYGERCVTVYVKRAKVEIIQSLLDRLEKQLLADPVNAEQIKADVRNRILSLESEKKNIHLCDKTVLNNKDLKEVIKFFL